MEVEPANQAAASKTPSPKSPARLSGVHLILLWLLAANLRTVLLAIAPLLPTIHHDLNLSETEVGLLTTLPLLLFGLAAVGGSAAVARLGARRTLFVGILVVAGASALRGVGDVWILFGASVLLGLAISVIQPVMPTVARAWFGARVSFATAVYSNGFMVGEAVAASITLALVVPLVGGWQAALVFWSLPCLVVAALIASPAGEVPPLAPEAREELGWSPKLGDRRTWRIGLFQGGGSVVYFGLNAYIPTELHAVGHPSLVGPSLAALNISQLAAAPLIALLARRDVPSRPVMAVCGAACLAGVALVAFFPGPLAVVGAGMAGLFSACAFVVAMALPAVIAEPEEVHQLSAGMFTIGYLLAFALPLLGGVLWDATGRPRTAFLPAAIGSVLISTALIRRHQPGVPDLEARLH